LEVFVNKFAHSRFEPAGFTKNPDIPIAKSITDYIFRWLGIQFVAGYRAANTPNRGDATPALEAPAPAAPTPAAEDHVLPAPTVKVNGHRKATAGDLDHIEAESHAADPGPSPLPSASSSLEVQQAQFARFQSDAPACDNCGALTVRCGTCYRCFNCGNSM